MKPDAAPRRVPLAQLPTPLLDVGGLLPPSTRLRVKRDDLTGAALSGNKVRKLEFLLAEAQERGLRRVVTCGGLQSNHCRATAIAARELGLDCTVVLRTATPPDREGPLTGNVALMRLVGAELRFVTPEQYAQRARLLPELAGTDGLVIPEGGSNALGAWGYLACVDELIVQWGTEPPTAIICATGSGGTLAGLAMGVRRRGLTIPVYGVCVCDDAPTFQGLVAQISAEAHARWPELPALAPSDVRVVEGWVGRGYALSTPDELADLAHVARTTGLVLDPVYTAKAFRALLRAPEAYGEAPLFVHTGGIFGLLAEPLQPAPEPG